VNDSLHPAPLLSPSLTARSDGSTAYEVKFLIDHSLTPAVESWAVQHLHRDPHGDPDRGGSYQITSLYTDTPSFDVYHRTPRFRRRKYRLRRYGAEEIVHLERKVRRGERVTKRRTSVAESELSLLGEALTLPDWEGYWFHKSLLEKSLVPTCLITYQRTAFLSQGTAGPLRLTLDHHVQGQLATEWSLYGTGPGLPLLPDQVVLELKFRDAMPPLFKQLVADLQLVPTGVSKYRRCLDAWNVTDLAADSGVKYA